MWEQVETTDPIAKLESLLGNRVPDDCYDLLSLLLDKNPGTRATW